MKEIVRRKLVIRLSTFVVILFSIGITGIAYSETNQTDSSKIKKVLYVASYSLKLDWSFKIKSGIESVFAGRKNLVLKAISMETQGMTKADEDKKKKAALHIKNLIDSWKPDIVITSDDNASKYLIVPYFKNAKLPFVFCGVNWDASKYGFPSENVTGMLEVQLVDQLVKYLSPYARGKVIGSIRGNTMTNRSEAEHFKKHLGENIKTYFVENVDEWKKTYIKIQNEVDIILLGDLNAIKIDPSTKVKVEEFIIENTKIPTGHWDAWFRKNALITLATIPEEMGEYSAQAALQILDGKSPADIPIVENKRAKVYLNMKLAKKMGIIFPMELIESAQLVSAN